MYYCGCRKIFIDVSKLKNAIYYVTVTTNMGKTEDKLYILRE